MPRVSNKVTAREWLRAYGVPLGQDFHRLDSTTVEAVLEAAKAHKYRKPHSANGSKARCFYEYANR